MSLIYLFFLKVLNLHLMNIKLIFLSFTNVASEHISTDLYNCLRAVPEAFHLPHWEIYKGPCQHGLFSF